MAPGAWSKCNEGWLRREVSSPCSTFNQSAAAGWTCAGAQKCQRSGWDNSRLHIHKEPGQPDRDLHVGCQRTRHSLCARHVGERQPHINDTESMNALLKAETQYPLYLFTNTPLSFQWIFKVTLSKLRVEKQIPTYRTLVFYITFTYIM